MVYHDLFLINVEFGPYIYVDTALLLTYTHIHADTRTHTFILSPESASVQSHCADRPNERDANTQLTPKLHPSTVGTQPVFPLV